MVDAVLTAVFAIIIEDDQVIEVRPSSVEELAAWMDQRSIQEDGQVQSEATKGKRTGLSR
jgi:hypothetical protein